MERVDAFANVARTATALAEAGLKPEALYTLSETINIARTEDDLAHLREYVVPAIREVESQPVLQKLPGVTAVRIRPRSDLMSDRARLIYGLENDADLEDMVLFVQTPKASPNEIFKASKDDLSKGGDTFAVLLDLAAATAVGLSIGDVVKLIGQLKPRQLPSMTKDTVLILGNVARDLALGGAYEAARTAALLTGAIVRQMKTEDLSITEPMRMMKFVGRSVAEAMKGLTSKATSDMAAEKLYRLGYGAQCSDFYGMTKPSGQLALPAWLTEENEPVLKSIEHHAYASIAPAEPQRGRAVSFDEILNTVARDLGHVSIRPTASPSTRSARPSPMREERKPVARSVNVWLEDSEPPLVVGISRKLGVNIGAPRSQDLSRTEFSEPDWGARMSLAIAFILTADRADVTPQVQPSVLPRSGDSEPVSFEVMAQEPGPIEFTLLVVTERAWELLERVSFSIGAVEENKAATA